MRARLHLVALAALAPAPLAAQGAHPHATEASAERPDSVAAPIARFAKGLGPFSRRLTTASADAQGYFDQGMQLAFAFAMDDAARSFREAARRDSACAMCAWGEAWALGPYLNGPMQPDAAPRAAAAAARAATLAPGRTSPVERALIAAMAVRYRAPNDSTVRARLDTAYAEALGSVHRRFPADAEVATLYAEALMLLEPRRARWDAGRPAIRRIHAVLESVLARNLAHPGACHLYIHATESTAVPGKAERCAERLADQIPGASHLQHMPSHTFNRIGRWGDAVRANLRAWHADQLAAVQEGFAVYPSHNLHMLVFAASMDGQGAIAIQAGKDYAKRQPGGGFMHALALLRFGRFDEIPALTIPPANPTQHGLWLFAHGYAQLRLGHADSARALLDRVDSLAAVTPDSLGFRGHPPRRLLGITGGILRAELARAAGDLPAAIALLEAATAQEDSLGYDEPEPLNFSARHWLGAALLDAGRAAEAASVYRAALADHPRTGWALVGLAQALRADGRAREAAATEAVLAEAWARADVLLRSSRF